MALKMTVDLNVDIDVLDAWLRQLRTDNTRRAYSQGLEHLVITTGKRITDINRHDLALWVDGMRMEQVTEPTIHLRLCAVSSFFRYAVEQGTIQVNPTVGRSFRHRIGRYAQSRFLSVEDAKRMLGGIQRDTVSGMRDYALILGYLVLGRRNSEWRTARVCDFEDGDGIHFRWSGKGHEGERIGIPAQVWIALQAYVQASGGRGTYDFIFLSRQGREMSSRRIEQIVQRYAQKAGIVGRLRVHDLRHTAAMLWRQAGADVEELREFLGHVSLNTTQIYLHRLEGVSVKRSSEVENMLNLSK